MKFFGGGRAGATNPPCGSATVLNTPLKGVFDNDCSYSRL